MAPPASVLDDRYRLDDRIAEGGMGEVWRATDLLLTRPVAVKLLHPAYTGDEAGLARFRTEAQYAGSLSHPNIAHIYDYWGGEPPGQPYLVMELVDGPSLAGLLADGPLSPERTLEIISQAAAGLEAAHAAGLVHRDIKPGNLLVSKTGQIKIADFGIASAVGSAPVTRTGEVIGTPAYLSPEQSAGRSATPASDLYALGIVAYQCLAGEPPFQGEPLAVALAHQERNLPPLPASVPLAVAAFVSHLAAKDPDARPASAGEVALRAERLRATVTGGSPALTWLPAASAQPATPTMADLQAQAGRSPAGRSPAGLRLAGTSQAGAALAAAGQPESTAVNAAAAVPVAATAASGPAGAAGATQAAAGATQAAQTEGTAAPADTASAPQTAGTPAVTALARSGAHDTQEAAASLVPAGPAYAAGAGRPRDRGNPAAWVIGGRARTRTALAAAAVVVFALAGWALSSLPAASLPHRDPPPVPTARASAPATDPGVVPGGTPPPHTVATPSPDTAPSRPARPAVAAASPSPSPSTARAPTPSTTPSTPSTPAGTPTPSAPASPTPSTSATATPSASPG